MDIDELASRVEELTGLNARASRNVAITLGEGDHTSKAIVEHAAELGYEVKPGAAVPDATPAPTHDAEVTMDPAKVLDEVYMVMPRVLCANMPKIGKAPEAAHEHGFSDLIAELPDDVQALLVKLDVYEGQATFWLRDEANEIDRPIGPIDLKRFDTGEALNAAFQTLMRRLEKVITADFN